jgi:hypothetical protein
MAHLRRSLIAVGQTHRFTAAIQQAVRIFRTNGVDYRSFGGGGGIAVVLVVDTPAVTNDKYNRSHSLAVSD